MAALLLLLVGGACFTQGATTPLEQEAQSINRQLMCPVCPAETIDQSQVPLAQQMRDIVREKLEAGESRQQVLDFFVERYGEGVLAAPPKAGFNLVGWALPAAGVVGAVVVLLLAVRGMRSSFRRQAAAGASRSGGASSGDEALAPYLAKVDEDIAQLLAQPSLQGSSEVGPR